MKTFESFMQVRPDMEGLMVKSQLMAVIEDCQKIIDMIEDDTELPAWIQSKVAISQSGIGEIQMFMKMMVSRVETAPVPSVDLPGSFGPSSYSNDMEFSPVEEEPEADEEEPVGGLESYEDFIKDDNQDVEVEGPTEEEPEEDEEIEDEDMEEDED